VEATTSVTAQAPAATPPGSGHDPLGKFRVELDGLAKSGDLLNGQYRIRGYLGGGGDGLVYDAEDILEHTRVALKAVCVAPDAPSEVNIAREFAHPSVCRLYQSFRHGEIRVVVMEFAEGETLSRRLKKGDFSANERLQIFRLVAEGVRAMHAGRVLHLDLKPENILLRRDGTPVVTDFGVAVRIPEGQRAVEPLGGTHPYWPPEQRRAFRDHSGERVDERADVHALGMILMRDLFPGSRGVIARIARRATARRAEGRFRSVAALLDALDANKRRRRRLRIVGIGVGIMVLVPSGLRLGLSDWVRGRTVERSIDATLHIGPGEKGNSDLGSRRSSELYCAWFQSFPNGSVFLVTPPTFRKTGRFTGMVFVFARSPTPRWTLLGDDPGEPLYVVNDARTLADEWRNANGRLVIISEQTGLLPLGGPGPRPQDREPYDPELERRFSDIPGADPRARLGGGIARIAAHLALTNFIGWPFQSACRTEIVVQEYDKGFVIGGAPYESCGDGDYVYVSTREGSAEHGRWEGSTPSALLGGSPVSNKMARVLDGGGLCKREK